MCNITENLKELLCMSQEEILQKALQIDDAVELNEGSVFVEGTIPLVLVAHMDTVYPTEPEKICERGTHLYTPKGGDTGIGGDDRCGCAILFEAVTWEFRPALLFCSNEETCAGSSVGLDMLDWSDYKAFIELDGPGYGVFYAGGDTSNEYLNGFLQDEIGLTKLATSYNDIMEICVAGNPPGVTLGAAYYNQHDESNEWVSSFGINIQVEVVKLIVKNIDKLEWSVLSETKKWKSGYGAYGGSTTYLSTTNTREDYGYDYVSDYYGGYGGSADKETIEKELEEQEKFYCCSVADNCADCEFYDMCDDAILTQKKEVDAPESDEVVLLPDYYEDMEETLKLTA